MNWEQIAKDMAELCLRYEPPKARGGSSKRQDWLRLVLAVQLLMVEMGVGKTFEEALLA